MLVLLATSPFADFRAIDPKQLFRLANGYLLWPNGAVLRPIDEVVWNPNDLFFLLREAANRTAHRAPFSGKVPTDAYLNAKVLQLQPDTLVRFSYVPRWRDTFRIEVADTMRLAEVRWLVSDRL